MLQTWEHILNGLCDVLKNDPKIRSDVFDENSRKTVCGYIIFFNISINDSSGL